MKKFLTEQQRKKNLAELETRIAKSFIENFNKIKRIDEKTVFQGLDRLGETQYNETGNIEIKPKDDARCPDGKCQMYNVYYNGDGIYEFSSNSFKDMDPKKIALQLFDT